MTQTWCACVTGAQPPPDSSARRNGPGLAVPLVMSRVVDGHAATVLLVDEDAERRVSMARLLETDGYAVATAHDAAMAASCVGGAIGVAVVSAEIPLGAMGRLVRALRERFPALQVVLVGGIRPPLRVRETIDHLGALAHVPLAEVHEALPCAVAAAARVH